MISDNTKKNLAVIPARSGSKGLKNKNILPCAGKPLMAYSIEAALRSGIFDTVHVSTDSEEYAQIAKTSGADVPFLRPQDLASDTAGSWDVVRSVLRRYQELGREFDTVTLLQPTSPLRDEADILKVYQEFLRLGAGAVVTVCEMDHSPLWSNVLPPDGSMEGFVRTKAAQRQELSTYYRINGAVYMVDCGFLSENTDIYRKGCYACVMDREKSIDIDTAFDLELAEFLLDRRGKKQP